MSAHLLSNYLTSWGRDKMRGLPKNLSLFATSFKNSIVQEHDCEILLSYDMKIIL